MQPLIYAPYALLARTHLNRSALYAFSALLVRIRFKRPVLYASCALLACIHLNYRVLYAPNAQLVRTLPKRSALASNVLLARTRFYLLAPLAAPAGTVQPEPTPSRAAGTLPGYVRSVRCELFCIIEIKWSLIGDFCALKL